MSQINKDTIITQCANGYRMVTGTSNPIKYGELGTLISTLSNGVTIGDITYDNDGTITVTEDDGTTTHTLATTYTNGVLTALTYDGNSIALTYDVNGNLTVLGDTPIDVSGYAGQEILDNTVKFVVEDNTYQIVSVNAGAAVAAVTEPIVQGFAGWLDSGGNTISFPYTPVGDETLTALILENYGYVTVSAGDVLFIVEGITHTKSNTGFALCASYSVSSTNSSSTYYNVVCVSPDAPAAEFVKSDGRSVTTARTLTYAGTTWHYCVGSISDVSDMPTADTSGLGRYYLGWHGTTDDYTSEMAALAILNAYYGT